MMTSHLETSLKKNVHGREYTASRFIWEGVHRFQVYMGGSTQLPGVYGTGGSTQLLGLNGWEYTAARVIWEGVHSFQVYKGGSTQLPGLYGREYTESNFIWEGVHSC